MNKQSYSYVCFGDLNLMLPPCLMLRFVLLRQKYAYGVEICVHFGIPPPPHPPKWRHRKLVLNLFPPIDLSAVETRGGLHPTHSVICSQRSFKICCQINRLFNSC